MRTTLWTAVLVAVTVCASLAQGACQMARCSINSGGGSASAGAYRLESSIGQSAAGFVKSTSSLHWVGFWAGDIPTPILVGAIGAAKLLPDGAFVSIPGGIATSAAGDFVDFLYVEQPDRSSGIRISMQPVGIEQLIRGSMVNAIGTLGVTSAGERQLTGPIVVVVSRQEPLMPLGMANKSLGGSDLGNPATGLGQYGVSGGVGVNNVGLLVESWGQVTEVGSDYFVIDDGSSTPVRVDTVGMSDIPSPRDYITVVGISSLYKPGADRLRIILPRTREDVGLSEKR